MQKIIVIGCPGSGKTTFSLKLAEKLGIALFHLDAIWYTVDRGHIAREDFDEKLGAILEKPTYIIDGNYSRTLERRIAAADTVFFFDLPTEICLEGATARLGKSRVDMPFIDETLDPAFRDEIERFRGEVLPTVYALLEKYAADKRVQIFKSREDADEFLLEF